MNKKALPLLILLIIGLFIITVRAQELPTDSGSADVEKADQIIGNFSPIEQNGDVNFSKYQPFKSKADERIQKINLWLEINGFWLKSFFGMIPQLSWTFALDLYLMLFFFLMLILKAETTVFFLSGMRAKAFGIAAWLFLMLFKVYARIAIWGIGFIHFLWTKVLPMGIAVAVIMVIVIIVLFILLLVFAPELLEPLAKILGKALQKKAEEQAGEQIAERIKEDSEVLHAQIEKLEGK